MLTRTARLFLGLIAATSLSFVAACTNSEPLNPLTNAAGTYQMSLFRGVALPVTDTYVAGDNISTLPNGGTVTWTDGTMVLNSNGTFIETNNYTVTPTGGTSLPGAFVSSGTYTVRGTAFTLNAPVQNTVAARSAIGTISANTIDYQEANSTGFDSFQYKR